MKLMYFLLIAFLGCQGSVFSQIKKININGAEINYIDTGIGPPVIFVHGGMEDYRTWEAQIDSFPRQYRVIAYSRKFNFPNQNTEEVNDFSAETEANDLAEFITALKLQPVHLVGHSFGGLISIFLAKKHPELVSSLTLSEPTLINWLPGFDGGQRLYDDFYGKLWGPVKQAFKQKDTMGVIRHTLIYFAGVDLSDKLPAEALDQLIANFPEWRSIAFSSNAFSPIDKKDIQNLKGPILLLSAGQTLPIIQNTNVELKRLLPGAQTCYLADATHDYWMTHSKQLRDALLNFIKTTQGN